MLEAKNQDIVIVMLLHDFMFPLDMNDDSDGIGAAEAGAQLLRKFPLF
jgi:hypothetical protein